MSLKFILIWTTYIKTNVIRNQWKKAFRCVQDCSKKFAFSCTRYNLVINQAYAIYRGVTQIHMYIM